MSDLDLSDLDLAFTSTLEQAQRIQKGELSPLELTQFYFDRIDQLDPQLGSFVSLAREQALAEAQTKTEQLSKNPEKLPPFFGVPTAIKDLNPVEGLPYYCGVAALKMQDNRAAYDDAVTSRLKAAGFIILGKTATSEVGLLPYTEPPGFPPTRNPWNLDYTSGGSSGGAATAVAAGLCSVAQGSDGGGSIRTPAACCGLVGLKAARGRVSHAPVGDYQSGIAINGVLTRTVADTAALLDVISGYVTGDPYWLNPPEIPFLEGIKSPPKGLKIAFSTQLLPLGEASGICAEAVLETAKRLEGMGHFVEEACPDFNELVDPFVRIWAAGVGASGIPLEAFSPLAQALGEKAGSAGEYLRAVYKMQALARGIIGFFDRFDILVLPSYLHPPIRIGEWSHLSVDETVNKIVNWVAPSAPANVTGLPAITIPFSWQENGVPIGVQLMGKVADEMTLLALAAQLEESYPWHDKKPSIVL